MTASIVCWFLWKQEGFFNAHTKRHKMLAHTICKSWDVFKNRKQKTTRLHVCYDELWMSQSCQANMFVWVQLHGGSIHVSDASCSILWCITNQNMHIKHRSLVHTNYCYDDVKFDCISNAGDTHIGLWKRCGLHSDSATWTDAHLVDWCARTTQSVSLM